MKTIQTGLRLPEPMYNEFRDTQQQTGISINQQVLYLINVGRRVIHLGLEQARCPVPTEECTDVQDARPGC